MKHVLWGALLCVLCLGCAQRENTYLIEGDWKDGEGQVVYLKSSMDKDAEILDSAVVQGGVFKMQQPLAYVHPRALSVNGSSHFIILDSLPIHVKCEQVKAQVKGKEIERLQVKIEGSVEQDIFKAMLQAQQAEMFLMLGLAYAKEDPTIQDTLAQVYIRAKEQTAKTIDSLVTNYPNSYAAALILRDFVAKHRELPEVEEMYGQLTPWIRQSYLGREVKAIIDARKTVAVGSVAPDFALQTLDGKTISLKDLRGKFVLVDFWASWCGPCMAEVPNVKKVYEKFHVKGFEVVGVSLDEKKEAWTNAIAKHGLSWLHVSSLKGWKCPVAAQYSVTGIPATFLLDPEGKIIARNLRGEELMEAVAKVL